MDQNHLDWVQIIRTSSGWSCSAQPIRAQLQDDVIMKTERRNLLS